MEGREWGGAIGEREGYQKAHHYCVIVEYAGGPLNETTITVVVVENVSLGKEERERDSGLFLRIGCHRIWRAAHLVVSLDNGSIKYRIA